ncbi:hypothetical protein T4A_4178 [Trichinella pseudospiralis]|uniref:Uncharacterized protein n=1 Tax=Trichinella pseudospiralis TaxID=6337 RepID=A0A0V1E3I1_TRIPS|nr:hypothetical protein T4A_4178 [Trichinella pseudospiralis]
MNGFRATMHDGMLRRSSRCFETIVQFLVHCFLCDMAGNTTTDFGYFSSAQRLMIECDESVRGFLLNMKIELII